MTTWPTSWRRSPSSTPEPSRSSPCCTMLGAHSLPAPGVVAEWLKAAVLKGDPPVSHSVRLSPAPPCCVCTWRAAVSRSVPLTPLRAARSPHKTPHSDPGRRCGRSHESGGMPPPATGRTTGHSHAVTCQARPGARRHTPSNACASPASRSAAADALALLIRGLLRSRHGRKSSFCNGEPAWFFPSKSMIATLNGYSNVRSVNCASSFGLEVVSFRRKIRVYLPAA